MTDSWQIPIDFHCLLAVWGGEQSDFPAQNMRQTSPVSCVQPSPGIIMNPFRSILKAVWISGSPAPNSRAAFGRKAETVSRKRSIPGAFTILSLYTWFFVLRSTFLWSMRHSFSLTCAVPLSGGHRTETSQAEVTRQAEYRASTFPTQQHTTERERVWAQAPFSRTGPPACVRQSPAILRFLDFIACRRKVKPDGCMRDYWPFV